ncbi:ABC transporter ATP-binding protein [Devosia riboflavina]|uniref:ABC transporter ATP-binding protein n=1 Tax=Devosia riboflavina TaxID=46914 RepID=UPI00068AED6D|nr:ABC transporter ATP-binding protein [Devosia riboflavina]
MTPSLKTHDLAVGYRSRGKSRTVLRDINVQVSPGELVCLLGVNGIGKSTLMRTLARMEPALGGSVAINGADITRMSQYDLARNVAVVLTERVAVGSMPAFRLVELGRYPHVGWSGLLSEEDRAIVRDAVIAVGAEHLARREINELSDGERQRIMIARALAQRPAVLLLDEPAAFLDVSARVEIVATLRRLARERNVAVVLSIHDLDLSLRMADTIWLIDGAGRMHIGAPEDLLADGSISSAFSGPNIAFSAGDRTFKIREHPYGKAFVGGTGEGLGMARTVLEREGFEITHAPEGAQLMVTMNASGWEARGRLGTNHGASFGELARFVRQEAGATLQTEPQP